MIERESELNLGIVKALGVAVGTPFTRCAGAASRRHFGHVVPPASHCMSSEHFGHLAGSQAAKGTARSENARLKKLRADAMRENAALKDLLAKKW
jgi:hypothetical protein